MAANDASSPPSDPPSSGLRVEPFSGDPSEWDEVVEQAPEGGVFHLHAWKEVMAEGLGHEVTRMAARDAAGGLRGVLPLVRVRSLLFGDYLVSMPFLNDGGPVGTPEARKELGAWAVGEARRLGVDLLELRSSTPVPGELETSDRKITVKLPLPDDPDTLFHDEFRSKLRSQIRRPMKEDMDVRIGAGELLDPFYDIFAVTMRDLGTPVLPRSFFQAICDHLGDHVIASVIEHEGQPVATGLGFRYGEAYEITWAGALREFSRMAPNMLMYWSLMEACIERDVRVFDFGRCTPGSGTHRFKSQWGGDDHPLPWAQWSPPGKEVEPPNPESGKYRLAVSAWTRLPLSVTRTVGPWLSRLLP